jgi:ankyrin repeat protein
MGTPLHAAARYDSLDAAVLLVRAKAVVQAKNRAGYTPLEQAVRWRAHSVAEMLLVRAKADVNAASTGSSPVMDLALQNADYRAVTLLLDAGINVAPPTLHFPAVAALFASMPAYQTASSVVLHEALQRGDRAVAEFLVVHAKVDVNATHPSLKRRPIDTALKKRDFSMAQLLLDAKAVLPHGRHLNRASTHEPRINA